MSAHPRNVQILRESRVRWRRLRDVRQQSRNLHAQIARKLVEPNRSPSSERSAGDGTDDVLAASSAERQCHFHSRRQACNPQHSPCRETVSADGRTRSQLPSQLDDARPPTKQARETRVGGGSCAKEAMSKECRSWSKARQLQSPSHHSKTPPLHVLSNSFQSIHSAHNLNVLEPKCEEGFMSSSTWRNERNCHSSFLEGSWAIVISNTRAR